MNLFTSILIPLLVPVLHSAEREIIPGSVQGFWTSTSAAALWTFENAVVDAYPLCPSSDRCLRLEVSDGHAHSEAETYTSSLGYYSINAEWEMRTELLDSNPDLNKCKVFFVLGA
eukprot:256864_1